MKEILDLSRIFLSFAFLMYASWSDVKKREVSNKVWMFFAPLAFVLTSFQLYTVFSTSSMEVIQQTLFICTLSFLISGGCPTVIGEQLARIHTFFFGSSGSNTSEMCSNSFLMVITILFTILLSV